ncbi:glutaminase A [Pelosinus baikalensis]|uniref:Glutaminase n=1 Tax=Pelosinus baikalensis TaxID=2892015 RepID=A0ABS8HZF9_9FIRM|nr:glutaminase A [Pelosinus baikalensis]MCC5468525.1 glutaminase A [Pelosinus baikalensis]
MNQVLQEIIENNRSWTEKGTIATYIPELAKANPHALGVYLVDMQNNEYFAGDVHTVFSIQSISKIITFICALTDTDFNTISKVISVEPTADEFNSIANLEIKNTNKPLNPMINSGAIATITLVKGKTYEEKFQRIFHFFKLVTDNPNLTINEAIYQSESSTGDRNRSLAYYMKSTGIIHDEVEEILNIYFKLCSINVTCKDIARIGVVLANNGIQPYSNQRVIRKDICQIVKAVMSTCGMYSGSGSFATTVGMPAKSGVGGGILAVVPHKFGIGVVGPALDASGNSIAGIKVLTELSSRLDLSIY